MKELLEAGVHFGHQTKRWNPKMKEYIFGERNGIYIVDLQKTLKLFKDAMRYVGEMAAQGKTVLFVGTKRQAQEAIAEEATKARTVLRQPALAGRLLTNIATVQRSIKRLKELDSMANENAYEGRAKKEVGRLERERKHLQQNLAGIKDMNGLPGSAVRDRFKQRSHRRQGSSQAGHSGGCGCRHQLRSRRSGLRDPGQR